MRLKGRGGRNFYRILITLISIVLAMATLNGAVIGYLHRTSLAAQTSALAASMDAASRLMDDFLQEAVRFYADITNSPMLAKLANRRALNLEQAHSAQTALKSRFAGYAADAEYVSEIYLYLYGRDSVITTSGVTMLNTFFRNRFSGEPGDLKRLLYNKYSFALVEWPFGPPEAASEWFVDSELAIAQTIFVSGQAAGTLVITLNRSALPIVLERYLVVPGSRAYIYVNGAPFADAPPASAAIPAEEFSGHIPGTGIVSRRDSRAIPAISYVVFAPEEALLSAFARSYIVANATLALAACALAALSYAASRRLYLPLRRLLNETGSGGELDLRTDEAKLLVKSIRAIHDENRSIRSALDTSAPLVRDALLYHMLWNRARGAGPPLSDYLPTPAPNGLFYAFVAALSPEDCAPESGGRLPRLVRRVERDIGPAIIATVQTGAQEFTFVTYPLTDDLFAALRASVAQAVDAIAAARSSELALVAAGRGVPDIGDISESFATARAQIAARPASLCCALLDQGAPAAPQEAFLPPDMELSLASLIKSGGEAEALAYIRGVLERNRNASIQAFLKVAYLINSVLMRSADAAGAERMIDIQASHTLVSGDQITAILGDNLAIALSRADAPAQDLRRVTEYIEREFRNGVSLAGTAAHFGYNESYFSRYFKQKAGVSFVDYLNRVKITQACRMLRETDLSVRQVAEASGFNSSGQFITVFSRIAGTTPGAYKKRFRQ